MKVLSIKNAFTVEGKKGSMKLIMGVAKLPDKPNNFSHTSMHIEIIC